MLTNLENQFYRIDEEYNRRKISTYGDRVVIYGVMLAVLPLSVLSNHVAQGGGAFILGLSTGRYC